MASQGMYVQARYLFRLALELLTPTCDLSLSCLPVLVHVSKQQAKGDRHPLRLICPHPPPKPHDVQVLASEVDGFGESPRRGLPQPGQGGGGTAGGGAGEALGDSDGFGCGPFSGGGARVGPLEVDSC